MRKASLIVAASLVVVPLLNLSPAWAAPPGNDTSDAATAASIGFAESLDTTEATTDGQDAQFNELCGAPATDASVWYTVSGTGLGVVVDVSGSSYSAGVMVGTGVPGSLELVTCGPNTVGFFADPGTTYYVLAFDDQFDGGGNGGVLNISFTEAPPPPQVDITVDPRGTFNPRTGSARLSGTYTCLDASFLEVFGEARQRAGRVIIRGFFGFFDEGTCDGTPRRWSAEVVGDNGTFAGGRALTVTFAFGCGPFECAEGFVEQTVRLSGKRR